MKTFEDKYLDFMERRMETYASMAQYVIQEKFPQFADQIMDNKSNFLHVVAMIQKEHLHYEFTRDIGRLMNQLEELKEEL